jgi:hypothetical protein
MAVDATPGFDLQPSATQIPTATNYIISIFLILMRRSLSVMVIERLHLSYVW